MKYLYFETHQEPSGVLYIRLDQERNGPPPARRCKRLFLSIPSTCQNNNNTKGEVEDTQTEIENTVDAHTMEMPRVQNAIGLYTNITRIKWNYETEGEIMAGWLVPPEAGVGMKGANGTAVVEGFQFDAAGKDDFEVANKLWDVIDGKARAMVEA